MVIHVLHVSYTDENWYKGLYQLEVLVNLTNNKN